MHKTPMATLEVMEAFFQQIGNQLRAWPHPLVNGLTAVVFKLEGYAYHTEPAPHRLFYSERYMASWQRAIAADTTWRKADWDTRRNQVGPREQRWHRLVRRYLAPQPPPATFCHHTAAWHKLVAECEANGLQCRLSSASSYWGRASVVVRLANPFRPYQRPLHLLLYNLANVRCSVPTNTDPTLSVVLPVQVAVHTVADLAA